MPYISASIVVQLMGIAILFAKNFKVMESGRKRLIRLHVG
jgi:preprotein translocase subunit SecY